MSVISVQSIEGMAHDPEGREMHFALRGEGGVQTFRCGHAELDTIIYALQRLAATASERRRDAAAGQEPSAVLDEAHRFRPTEVRLLMGSNGAHIVLAAYGAEGRQAHLELPTMALEALARQLLDAAAIANGAG